MTSDALPQVLIAGQAQGGKTRLATKLGSTSDNVDHVKDVWHFSTKYYEAAAKLVRVSLPGLDLHRADSEEAGPVEAVILLHDCTQHQSFLSAKDYFEGPGNEVCKTADICLCIANKVGNVGNMPHV